MAQGGIDQLSMMLGAMQSDIKTGIKQREELILKVDKLTEIVPFVAELRKEMDETVLPAVKEWQSVKNRTAGIALSVGAGAGTAATGLFPWLKALAVKMFS